MRLTVTTPLAAILEADDVVHVRAEDPSGAFGVLPGHAEFLTALSISVLTWRDARRREHHIAVRGGMLSVSGKDVVTVATPEAVAGDDLQRLESEVLTRFRQQLEEERAARTESQQLHLAAIRQIMRLLRPETRHAAPPG
ncbi:MAG TPA: F0F1 ATP synthase subunit epsilon [Steroidobacteraceae bacterium]|nr:F0F1 ATP synthase subunit epsilon [Steroidobacteraceae bacterium]